MKYIVAEKLLLQYLKVCYINYCLFQLFVTKIINAIFEGLLHREEDAITCLVDSL